MNTRAPKQFHGCFERRVFTTVSVPGSMLAPDFPKTRQRAIARRLQRSHSGRSRASPRSRYPFAITGLRNLPLSSVMGRHPLEMVRTAGFEPAAGGALRIDLDCPLEQPAR